MPPTDRTHPFHPDLVELIAEALAGQRNDPSPTWAAIEDVIKDRYRADAVVALRVVQGWNTKPVTA